jgi:hypothetical protein
MPRSFSEHPDRYFSPGYRLLHSQEPISGDLSPVFDDPGIRKCIDELEPQEILRSFPRS